jgi:uncharacterized membrane protein (DUF373 family)
MERPKTATDFFSKILVKFDILFNIIIAFLLLGACAYLLYTAAIDFVQPRHTPIIVIHIINEVLLALIILEILWTVIGFLKDKHFTVAPFLAIGIIASIRRILSIEVQASIEHPTTETLLEIGVNALLILTLVVAYYLSLKIQKMNQ